MSFTTKTDLYINTVYKAFTNNAVYPFLVSQSKLA